MRPNLLLSLGQLLVFGSGGVQTLSKTIPVVNLNPDFDHRWWICKENKNGCLKIFHFCWKELGKQRWGEGLPFQANIVELSVKGILKVSFLKNQFFLMKMTICLRWKALVFQSPEYYPWSFVFGLGNHFPNWSNGMYEGIISVFSSPFDHGAIKSWWIGLSYTEYDTGPWLWLATGNSTNRTSTQHWVGLGEPGMLLTDFHYITPNQWNLSFGALAQQSEACLITSCIFQPPLTLVFGVISASV